MTPQRARVESAAMPFGAGVAVIVLVVTRWPDGGQSAEPIFALVSSAAGISRLELGPAERLQPHEAALGDALPERERDALAAAVAVATADGLRLNRATWSPRAAGRPSFIQPLGRLRWTDSGPDWIRAEPGLLA